MKLLTTYLFAAVFLTGCFCGRCSMNQVSFDDILIGMSVDDVEEMVGTPYSIRCQGSCSQEYEYIERIDAGAKVANWNVITVNHYFLIFCNGQVVAKRISKQRPPAYDLIYEDDPNANNY